MKWWEPLLDKLAVQPVCGYVSGQGPATEPTALAALALLSCDRATAGLRAAEWLADLQNRDGSVSVAPGTDRPRWTTSLAVLAWLMAESQRGGFRSVLDRAITWTCSFQGEPIDPTPDLGHDTTLVAWPWIGGTHSWIEPTSLHVVALKAAGRNDHPRTREAVRLLLDRQLPDGGCNYGNTVVLGNTLRPHVQPTGLALLALAGETTGYGRVARSASYLSRAIGSQSTSSSLSWALLGLAAHGRYPEEAGNWLQHAWQNTVRRGDSSHRAALIVLAAMGEESPLVTLPRRDAQIRQRTL